MEKKLIIAFNLIVIFLLIVLVALSAYTVELVTTQHSETKSSIEKVSQKVSQKVSRKADRCETVETIWLIPNDVSCGEFWTSEQLKSISGTYELKAIEKEEP